MAFVESDRVQIRHFLGFSALFQQADPRLENAITAVQGPPNGTRPDSSTEAQVLALVTSLISIETKLSALWDQAVAVQVDEIRVDVARGRAMLCMEGRRLVAGLEAALGTHKRRDIFSSGASNPDGDAFGDFAYGIRGRNW